MAELEYALRSGRSDRKVLRVQISPSAPYRANIKKEVKNGNSGEVKKVFGRE